MGLVVGMIETPVSGHQGRLEIIVVDTIDEASQLRREKYVAFATHRPLLKPVDFVDRGCLSRDPRASEPCRDTYPSPRTDHQYQAGQSRLPKRGPEKVRTLTTCAARTTERSQVHTLGT
ncbi:hypothetical protein VTK73DRAFT_3374 [Phialemonium thermophilum]|uniref:Uncharacterized protein n=1 Tax=Phialemonium thermophilum TaxID=223376 RepID=A0ABR3VJ60_9PEZI